MKSECHCGSLYVNILLEGETIMCKKLIFLTSFLLVLGLVSANVAPGAVLEVRVAASDDDMEEHVANGTHDLGSSDLEITEEGGPEDNQLIGLRFNNIAVPQGAVITGAYVQFHVDEIDVPGDNRPGTRFLRGEAVDNAATFSDTAFDIASRPTTSAEASWDWPEWLTEDEEGPDQRTSDIAAVIQEIVDRPGWSAGNSLALIISGSGENTAESFDGEADAAPLLHIEFTYDGASSPDPENGAIDVKDAPVLTWAAGETAFKHDLYLGTDADLVAAGDVSVSLGSLSETTFEVDVNAPLSRGTTYYWKVDVTTGSARESELHPGNVWSFRVADQNTESWVAAATADSPVYLDTFVENGAYDIGAVSGDITYEFVVLSNPDETEVSMALLGRIGHGDTTAALKYEQYDNTGNYGATIFGVADYDSGIANSPGEYTHLVIVSSEASGTTDLYVNGVDQQATAPTAITLAGIVGIGQAIRDPEGAEFIDPFDGTIFGVAIYDEALSDEQIAAHSDMYFNPVEEIIPVDPGAEGLVAYYAFENDANDSSGNEIHGTLVGDAGFAEGPAGYGVALNLDGDGDYVDCGLNPMLDITEQITFTYWMKAAALDKGWNTVLSRGDDSWRSSRAGEDNFMEAAVGGTSGNYLFGVTLVDDDKWHHVGAVYDGATFSFYVDGKLDSSEESTGSITISSYPLYIGNNSQNTDREWTGLIDEVTIYDRALSDLEVMYLAGKRVTPVDPGSDGLLAWWACDEGAGAVVGDSSGNGRDGTFVNGDPVWVEGIHGNAVELVGPTLIEIPPLDMELAEATMAGWIKPNGPQPDWSSIIMTRDPGLATGFNVLGYQLAYHWNDDSGSWSFRGEDMIAEDDWTFAAVTIEPDKATFYVNGEMGSVNEITHDPALWNSNIYLGGDGTEGWVGRRMIGALDDVFMYDRALSAGEIRYLAGARAMDDVLGLDVTALGDVVKGVPDEPREGSVAGWPDGEFPWLAVDDDVSTKFLHFRGEVSPTGFVVEPASGSSIVTGLTFTTANDAPERDPTSFEISGSNDSIDGPYELIATGDIVDFAQEVEWPRFTMNATPITFDNGVAYKYYQVMFPTVRDAASANSMQIAEVELRVSRF